MDILVFSERVTPRLRWILREVLWRRLGLTPVLVDDREAYRHGHVPGITYARERVGRRHELVVWPAGLLQEEGITPAPPPQDHSGNVPVLFPAPPGYDLPFDLFSAAFHLLSRYEEYLPGERDRLGRFPARASLAWQGGWLDRPVVDEWALWLLKRMTQKVEGLQYRMPPLRFVPTLDVDQAFAYRHKPLWRLIGGGLVQGDLRRRWRVWTEKEKDPYDIFPEIFRLHEPVGEMPLLFFHTGRWGRYDKGISLRHEAMRRVVQYCASRTQLGIHPSVKAARAPRLIANEKALLEEIYGRPVIYSRMHYLMLRFPEIPRALLQAGIRQDYSLGYPEAPGFRAGTCHPFQWYDLEREEETSLLLVPLTAMDGALRHGMRLSPGQSVERLEQLRKTIEPYGGLLVTLWHNHTLAGGGDWQPWAEAYLHWMYEHFASS